MYEIPYVMRLVRLFTAIILVVRRKEKRISVRGVPRDIDYYRQHSMKNRRAVGLLNPMWAIKIEGKNRGEEGTTPTCDQSLSRSWKGEVWGRIK